MLVQGWYIGLIVLPIIIIFALKSWLRVTLLSFTLPGPPFLSIVGSIFLLKDNQTLVKFGRSAYDKYGSIFKLWLTVIPTVVIVNPKHLQRILGSAKLTDKNFLYTLMHTFIGDGLITSSGHTWKSHRKYIQPYFHLSNLEKFLPTFAKAAQIMVKQLKFEEEVKISTYINSCVFNILHEAVLGIPIENQVIKNRSPFNRGHLTIIERLVRPWLLFNFIYNRTFKAKQECKQNLTLQEFTRQVLMERRRLKRDGKASGWCFLENLMEIAEKNPDFTNKDIVNEACTLMLAGQDSVGSAVVFTLYHLAKHQNIQNQVVEELKNTSLCSKDISIDTLNKMKYLEQCIMEAMRLCPSVPVIARQLAEDVKLDDHVLPVGCNIFITPFVTHRLPTFFPDPEKFDPERFSQENKEKRTPFACIPFSAGPRNCIGYKFAMLEMKTIICTILQNYKVSLVPGYKLDFLFRVTLRAKGGVCLRLEPR